MKNENVALSVSSLLNAQAMRAQMLLVQAGLEKKNGGYIVTIPADSTLTTTGAGRKQLESPQNTRWRWAAGGGLIMLRCLDQTVALTRFRDPGAPSYGGHYTLGSGLSGSIRELLFPVELAIREAVEEFIIATPSGLAVPFFANIKYDRAAFGAVASGKNLIRQQEGLPSVFSAGNFLLTETTFAEPTKIPEEELEVRFEKEVSACSKGIIALDEGTRGIDILRLIILRLPFRLDEIAIFDGEADRQERPLNGEVVCFSVENGKVTKKIAAAFQTGKRIAVPNRDIRYTPPLKKAIEAM